MGKKIVCAVLILSFLFLAACQPTPEEKVVTQKEDILEDIETSGPTVEPYAAPEYWREENAVTVSDMTVDVDATIQIPGSGILPVASVESIDIDDKMTAHILDVFFDGQTVYIGDGIDTKSEIEEEILQEQESLAQILSMEDEELKQIKKDIIENTIECLKEQLTNAPEEHTYTEAKYDHRGETSILSGVADLSSKDAPYIRIMKSDTNSNNQITYVSLNQNEFIDLHISPYQNIQLNDEKDIESLRGITIPYNDARKIADELVSRVGAGELRLSAVNSAIIENHFDYDRYYKCPQCYVFRYTRWLNNDVPVTFDNTITSSDKYSPSWNYETVSVCVNDTGIIEFEWTSPSVVTGIVSEAVELLPFERIQQLFKNQFAISCAYHEIDPALVSRRIVIDEIILGLMRVARQDHPNEFLLIPVWDFYGYTTLIYNDDSDTQLILDENNEYTYRNYRQSFLTINAIDGTIIDRSVGY